MNLSVITITYNEPEALQRTLRSLVPLAASPLSWELVIVDSSTALNREIIGAFPMLPVNHVSQEPKGIYPAMNAGLALARGEIVWFLNGGDELLHANVLKSAVDTLGENSNSVMLLAAAELTRGGHSAIFATAQRRSRADDRHKPHMPSGSIVSPLLSRGVRTLF